MRARLAWMMLAVWVGLTVTGAVLYAMHGELLDVLTAPILAVFAGVGFLLSIRRPANPIGWMLLTVALLIGVSGVAQGFYTDALNDSRPGLLAQYLIWFDNWIFYVWVWLIGIMVPLLFPDGRLPSPAWRFFAWAATAIISCAVLANAFGTATLEFGTDRLVENPARAPGALGDALEALTVFDGPAFTITFLGALLGVLIRLRRSTGVERLQLTWVAYALALLIAGIVAAAVGELVPGFSVVGDVGWAVFIVTLILGLPLSIGIAILRHRLFDIDVVVKRTLVYGSLTAVLLATYFGLVLLFQLLLRPLAGESDLAVAASTLAVAALFRPLRSRIKAGVDRRFYRERYDATRTLEAFGARLRDELDLEALGDDLRRVVRDTVQPAHVTLWLRGSEAAR